MKSKLALLIASGFYSGFAPKAPGTFGTLTAVAVWYAGSLIFSEQAFLFNLIFFLLTSLGGLLATALVLKNEKIKDPQYIVIDEWAGVATALLCTCSSYPLTILAAFVLFRFFDITKPGIISKAEKYPGAYGVMLDDIISGFFSLILLLLLQYAGILPGW